MTFDWLDFFEFAKFLNLSTETQLEEARKRSVVSRAYFATYLIARDFAVENYNLQFSIDDNAHQKVINSFKDRGTKHGVYTCLLEFRRWRNTCDYDKSVTNLSSLATNSLQKAKHTIELITTA